jgi:hypothetical protein
MMEMLREDMYLEMAPIYNKQYGELAREVFDADFDAWCAGKHVPFKVEFSHLRTRLLQLGTKPDPAVWEQATEVLMNDLVLRRFGPKVVDDLLEDLFPG